MVQIFMALGGDELDAFRAYGEVYPDDCLLLVDTIDTLESGIPNAIKVFEELKRKGHRAVGIRLDSGDLAHLSVQAAKMLNEAGFGDAKIVLSNQLDELVIWQIISQIQEEAPRYGLDADDLINRLIYGIGTRLITSGGDPALDGVYKLTAVKDDGKWKPAIKISETAEKIPNPGDKRVWRIYDQRNKASADLISLEHEDPRQMDPLTLHHPIEHTTYRSLEQNQISRIESLLVDVLKDGKLIKDPTSIDEMRKKRITDLNRLDTGVRRIMNPHIYHVSLTPKLWGLKQSLITSSSMDNTSA
jgi:nicotinate phosphoribosyltransferase